VVKYSHTPAIEGGGGPSDNEEMDTEESRNFISESLNNRLKKATMRLGIVEASAKVRIAEKIGNINIEEITTSMDDVRHAYQPKHHLEKYDLLLAANVINTATDVSLSDRKHADNDVLVFNKDIDGEITFLAEVHVKKGSLVVFDCWHQKKARNRSDANVSPGANVQDVTPHADT
jgi:hypothetical protein